MNLLILFAGDDGKGLGLGDTSDAWLFGYIAMWELLEKPVA
ncbi:hypothetical protein ES319_D09G178700v1 [Gossypium barbadense]|uniref:Uncharacterized protein n=2 Tax=Gossypium TaxID=3633 RepID=A0A5J5Q4F3_GOSBA|nr:hypothetical protein ES319_D09G178700v1 [Gossypium barbadense]TYG54502.1 hypothetical protein ES288_D09G195500v1 [Gossypium darwinii]